MKRISKHFYLAFFLLLSVLNTVATNAIDPKKEKKLLQLLALTLEKQHYKPAQVDDWFSQAVFKTYIKSLDPNKRFFLKSDIEEFQKFESKIDDLIKAQDLSFFYMTHDRLKKRLKESKSIYSSLAKKQIDFTVDESINTDFEREDFAKNTKQLEEKWSKSFKYYVLDTLCKKLKVAENNQINSKFIKNFEQLEIDSRQNVLKKLNSDESNFELLDRDFYFSKYLNAIIAEFDPHSKYMTLFEKEEFENKITGKNIGIGLKFSASNNNIEIKEIIFGSPAWKNKKIDVGDILIGITEDKDDEVDVIGFNLQDISKLLKGKINTSLKIKIRKVDGTIKIISLKREIVEYKESYVKSCIVERYNEKIGIIDLPKFYKNLEKENQKDAAKDVAFEIENLKNNGVNGIILDLRDNGGGLVETAVEIAGFFIPNGPIVQIKSSDKNQQTLYDNDNKVLWDGPLLVMLNRNSASATEIFAAAIQDYNRGIIVGSTQSFGKGTVQTTIDMNQFNSKKDEENFGALKLTIQKYYRINGGSTQMKGVVSDIVMPDEFIYSEFGEKTAYNVLPWDKVEKIAYNKLNPDNVFEKIIEASKKRIENDINFKLIDEKAKLKSNQKNQKNIVLNFEKNKLLQSKIDADYKKFDVLNNYKNFLIFKSTAEEIEILKKNVALDFKRKEWHDFLSSDIYVDESLNIMSDLLKKTPAQSTADIGIPAKITKTKIRPKNKKK